MEKKEKKNMYTKKGIAINFYNLERWFYLHHLQALAEVTYRFMQFFLGCTIPYTVDLEKGCHIPHWHGIVMNEICKVGSGSYIFQNVTLGGQKVNMVQRLVRIVSSVQELLFSVR